MTWIDKIDALIRQMLLVIGADRVGGVDRLTRLVLYLAVGATGLVIDTATTTSLLSTTHYLVANATAFLFSNSWNYYWNSRVTFDAPWNDLGQYTQYLGVHVGTFVVFRASTVTILVEAVGVDPLPASLAGIVLAAAGNFFLSDTVVFGEGNAINRVSHGLYSRRWKHLLMRVGVWDAVYSVWQHLTAATHRRNVVTIEAGGEAVDIPAPTAAETASLLHTRAKEAELLEEFADVLREGDHVVDVGANLGVYSSVAIKHGCDVTAVEPHPPTTDRLAENIEYAYRFQTVTRIHRDVRQAAFGDEPGTTPLAVERDEPGTQTPEPATDGGQYEVPVITGGEITQKVDVVKIDVEGGEDDVLNGIDLDEPRVVLVECHDGESHARELLAEHFDSVSARTAGGQNYLVARRD